jgi:hypothetical protein
MKEKLSFGPTWTGKTSAMLDARQSDMTIINAQVNKTVHQWIDEKGETILDPDGFRDLGAHWTQVEMTEDEFKKRLGRCTVVFKPSAT